MIRAADERFVLGSKENLAENMEAFSLKVNIHFFGISMNFFFVQMLQFVIFS